MKGKSKTQKVSIDPLEKWCAELNQHFDELEACATIFLIASANGQLTKENSEELLDSGSVLNLIKRKLTEVEVWFEDQVNAWVRSDDRIVLPTGWLHNEARHHMTLISRDLAALEDATRAIGNYTDENTGWWAAAQRFVRGWNNPMEAIGSIFFDKSWDRVSVPLQKAARTLERDAQSMRTELAEMTANTWNNEIVPAITDAPS